MRTPTTIRFPQPLRSTLAVLLVLLAGAGGGVLALGTFGQERSLSVGRIALGVAPGHDAALDLYVPLVDWGVRFPAVRLPARLQVEVRALDRAALARIAAGELPELRAVRAEATDALTAYLRALVLIVALAALALGGLAALALRSRQAAPVGRLLAVATLGALACAGATALLLPPRGAIDDPVYYARGPDIPVALRALASVRRTPDVLAEELDRQLVGLARLVDEPGRRAPLDRAARLVVASDLHNNVLALPTLERAARGATVLLAGDVTDTGTAAEARLTARVARAGDRVVAVSGNHDSDLSMRRLAEEGAVVLDRETPPVTIAGVRIAGFDSPGERRAADGFADRGATITQVDRAAFTAWLARMAGEVDVVMVHEPELAAEGIAALRADPPVRPLLVVTGHTHRPRVVDLGPVLEVNPGTLGAGGTGNLGETAQELGLAIVTYAARPFAALAVDSVTIAPGSGSARAERLRR